MRDDFLDQAQSALDQHYEREAGARNADETIARIARTEGEQALLEALSVGHTVAAAARLAGISRSHANRVLVRLRTEETLLRY